MADKFKLGRLSACCIVFLAANFDILLSKQPDLVHQLGWGTLLRILEVLSVDGSTQSTNYSCHNHYEYKTVSVRCNSDKCPECSCPITDSKHLREDTRFPAPAAVYKRMLSSKVCAYAPCDFIMRCCGPFCEASDCMPIVEHEANILCC